MKNWIPNNNISKLAISIMVLCILLYLAGFFMVYKQTKEIEKIYKDSESGASKKALAFSLKSAYEANKNSIQFLRNFFVQKGDEVDFINEIETLGQKFSVKFELNSIDVGRENKDPFKEDIVIKINIEGGWTNIMSFLDGLEKTYFGVLINNLSLDLKDKGVWTGFVEVIIFREK